MAAAPETVTPKATTLESLRAPLAPREASMPVVRAGFDNLQSFELLQRAAKAFASSTLVPTQFQNNVPNCIIALELAQRIGASPLMVAQNLYVVHGRPSWSSQFLIAAVNQCGRFTALQYEWSGARNTDEWTCRAWAKDKATGERVQGPAVSIGMSKKEGWYQKNGSKWQTLPELMLMYRAAGFFARTNAPELTMGLSTQEEAYDVIDVTAEAEPATTLDKLREPGGAIEQPPAASEQITADASGEVVEEGAERTPEQDAEVIVGYIHSAASKDIADEALDLGNKLPTKALREKVKKAYDAKWGGA